MYKRIILVCAVMLMALASVSVSAKVTAPDWANLYGVVNIQRCGLYHFFEVTNSNIAGEVRLSSLLSNLTGGAGMMLWRKFDLAVDDDLISGTAEDGDLDINPEFKGIRNYEFTVSPTAIKGFIKEKNSPKKIDFDLAFQDDKLTGTAKQGKKTILVYDITFSETGISGTIGVKRNMHTVNLNFKEDELTGTIKGTKRFGKGYYTLDIDMKLPAISRERLSFILFMLVHQEFLNDFYRNLDFDMPYHAHGSSRE